MNSQQREYVQEMARDLTAARERLRKFEATLVQISANDSLTELDRRVLANEALTPVDGEVNDR